MARSTGSVDAQVDGSALSEVCSGAKKVCLESLEDCERIVTICKNMTSEEALKGGASEEIVEGFKEIAKGIENLSRSMESIAQVMDERLAQYLNRLNRSNTASNARDKAASTSKQVGRFKKE